MLIKYIQISKNKEHKEQVLGTNWHNNKRVLRNNNNMISDEKQSYTGQAIRIQNCNRIVCVMICEVIREKTS